MESHHGDYFGPNLPQTLGLHQEGAGSQADPFDSHRVQRNPEYATALDSALRAGFLRVLPQLRAADLPPARHHPIKSAAGDQTLQIDPAGSQSQDPATAVGHPAQQENRDKAGVLPAADGQDQTQKHMEL